jgi:NAD(P)H dehydrogenase (quinone)
MNVLIIHAHPEPASFNSALKDLAVKTFSERGDTVKVSDLYAMGFDAVGGKRDFTALADEQYFKYQAEQMNAYAHDLFAASLKEEMQKLEGADLLIFNFPLWWFSVPAILKGWVDRVFAMGFAYGGGKGIYDKGIFKGKKGMLCITTGGPEVAYGETGKNGDLHQILYHINHGMLYFVGLDVLPPFIVYSPVRLTEEERLLQLGKYEALLSAIEQAEPIKY